MFGVQERAQNISRQNISVLCSAANLSLILCCYMVSTEQATDDRWALTINIETFILFEAEVSCN